MHRLVDENQMGELFKVMALAAYGRPRFLPTIAADAAAQEGGLDLTVVGVNDSRRRDGEGYACACTPRSSDGSPWREAGPIVSQTTIEFTELLQTLIRNGCVNDGTAESGHETRNADVLQNYVERAIVLQKPDILVIIDRVRIEPLKAFPKPSAVRYSTFSDGNVPATMPPP